MCVCVCVGLFLCECLVSFVTSPGGRREANQMCMRVHDVCSKRARPHQVLGPETLCVGLARVGLESQCIAAGPIHLLVSCPLLTPSSMYS